MSVSWASLRNRSYYSLLKGSSKPTRLAERAVQLGLPAIALTDEGSITGSIAFIKALKETCSCGHHKNSHGDAICYGASKSCQCKEFNSANIKPIIGSEFRLRPKDGESPASVVVLAKNLAGWKSLISATSEANKKENIIDEKPYISLDALARFAAGGNWIGYAGAAGSELANAIFDDPLQLYFANSMPAARKLISGERYKSIIEVAGRYQDIFGVGNFYLEAQEMDTNFIGSKLLSNAVRWVSKQTGIPVVATANTFYAYPDDFDDQRLLVCTGLESDYNNVARKIAQVKKPELANFFRSTSYYMPSVKEIEDLHEVDEVRNSLVITDQCEVYNVLSKPILPVFDCPNGKTPDVYLKDLCVAGWKTKIEGKVKPENLQKYKDQIREELRVIQGAGLSSYFLIVEDYCRAAREDGQLLGPGRGCLEENVKIIMGDNQTKKIKDVKVGDQVISRDGLSHIVKNKMEYAVENESLLNVVCYYGDGDGVTLTKDHKILAEKRIRPKNYERYAESTKKAIKSTIEPTGKLEWVKAEELNVGDWVFVPSGNTKDLDYVIDLAKYCNVSNTRYDDDFVYHEKYNPLTKNLTFSKKIQRYIKIDSDWTKFLGMFVGNGWISKDYKGQIGVCFNGEHKEKIDFVIKFLSNLKLDYTTRYSKSGKLCQIYVRNKIIENLFRKLHNGYTSTSESKHVPEFIFNLNKNLITNYLKGYCLTDGHSEQGRNTFCTKSKRLAEEIRYLCRLVNLPSSLRYENRIEKRSGWGKDSTTYYITIPMSEFINGENPQKKYRYRHVNGGYITQIKSIKEVSGITKVYDINVESEANYLTSSFIVHNSSAGSLIAYLTNITKVDPIKYGLMFERFYNAGRNTVDRTSLPDIDTDFENRDKAIEYVKQKYGRDRVSNMVTFARIQGKGALKEVFRRKFSDIPLSEVERITKALPDEAAISDKLQEMKEAGEEPSIIMWALENASKELKDFCYIDDNDSLQGEYAVAFRQAVRLEGTAKSQGKHPSGLVITNTNLGDIAPRLYDKGSGESIAGFQMNDLEDAGCVKFDLLEIAVLRKLHMVSTMAAKGNLD